MNVSQTLKNPKVLQYVLELLFPIIGYLCFDWTLLIIIIFYLIDQIGAEIAFWFRLRFVQNLFPPKKITFFYATITVFLILFSGQMWFITSVFIDHFYDCNLYYFQLELINFLKQEFWILMPLIIGMHYMKDKMEFYQSKTPYQFPPKILFWEQVVINFSVFLLTVLVALVWVKFMFNEVWIILIIPICKIAFDFLFLPVVKAKLFRKN